MIGEAEFRAEIRRAYECGVQEARASFAADLRALADDMVHQVFELREEGRRALKMPPMASPDEHDSTLQWVVFNTT